MKKLILNDRWFRKKIKYFLVFGIGGILIFGGLVLYASVSVFNYVGNLNFEGITQNIPLVSRTACWDNAQNLLNVKVWLENPPKENLIKLKQVCMDDNTTICESEDCNNQRHIKTINEGKII